MSTDPHSLPGVDALIARAGGARALARALGISHQAIYKWQRKGYVPSSRVLEFERVYGVPREHLLRPDLAHMILY